MVHWPTQAAINQLTMRAATLALAIAATAAGLVAPSHAWGFGGFSEFEQPYPPELLAAADVTFATQGLVLACDSIADSIERAQSLLVSGIIIAGKHYEYTINTMTGILDCTTFVPLVIEDNKVQLAYNTDTTSKCFFYSHFDYEQTEIVDFGPDFCPIKTSAAGPMPAPGDE